VNAQASTEAPPAPFEYISAADGPRERLLMAMAQSIKEKGFTQTVVADVVRIARVSKRTFYEHFGDREECFLELCDAFAAFSRETIARAAAIDAPWREQLDAAMGAWAKLLTAEPALTRSFLFEIYSLGERGAVKHREVHRRFAEQFCELAEDRRQTNPELHPVSISTASAIVAGIGDLALLAVEDGGPEAIGRVKDTAVDLIAAVMTAPR